MSRKLLCADSIADWITEQIYKVIFQKIMRLYFLSSQKREKRKRETTRGSVWGGSGGGAERERERKGGKEYEGAKGEKKLKNM